MADRVMLADNKKVTDEQIERHLSEAGFLYGQPKIDGMRVYLGPDCIPLSRSGKEWKHKPLRAFAQALPSLRGLDGEVVPGHIYTEGSFREAMSGLRAEEGTREFTFFMFDDTAGAGAYSERLEKLHQWLRVYGEFIEADVFHAKLVVTPTRQLRSLEDVRVFEERMVAEGWEGAMLRRPDLPYKFGRSTNRGGELIKLKRYEDAEAIIEGYEPWHENHNEPTLSPLGYQVRSSHQDGKVPVEMLGAWRVALATDPSVKFKIGVMLGVTHEDRRRLWADRDAFVGELYRFKHQGYSGGYSVPRQPVGLGFRSQTEF